MGSGPQQYLSHQLPEYLGKRRKSLGNLYLPALENQQYCPQAHHEQQKNNRPT